jgi:transmembrane sensor
MRMSEAVPRAASAGELAMDEAGKMNITAIDADEIDAQLAWRRGWLRFNGRPLSEVVTDFNRYSTRHLIIVDPAIAETRFTGAFRWTAIDPFLKSLERQGIRTSSLAGHEEVIRLSGS